MTPEELAHRMCTRSGIEARDKLIEHLMRAAGIRVNEGE